MASEITVQQLEKFCVVELHTPSLMDASLIEKIGNNIYELIEKEDNRRIILDFEKVEFLSSQAIGIVLGIRKKLANLSHSQLILCGVGPRLMELMRITRLDRVLVIKPSQREALKVLPA